MEKKYLDQLGLAYFRNKLKEVYFTKKEGAKMQEDLESLTLDVLNNTDSLTWK